MPACRIRGRADARLASRRRAGGSTLRGRREHRERSMQTCEAFRRGLNGPARRRGPPHPRATRAAQARIQLYVVVGGRSFGHGAGPTSHPPRPPTGPAAKSKTRPCHPERRRSSCRDRRPIILLLRHFRRSIYSGDPHADAIDLILRITASLRADTCGGPRVAKSPCAARRPEARPGIVSHFPRPGRRRHPGRSEDPGQPEGAAAQIAAGLGQATPSRSRTRVFRRRWQAARRPCGPAG